MGVHAWACMHGDHQRPLARHELVGGRPARRGQPAQVQVQPVELEDDLRARELEVLGRLRVHLSHTHDAARLQRCAEH